jgi:hypothetical protein
VNRVGKFFRGLRNSQVSFSTLLDSIRVSLRIVRVLKFKNGEQTMPVQSQSQEQETLNVKLVHFTKQNSPDEPVQVAFSVVDDQGKEEIITGEIPYSYDLFRIFQENGWLNIRRGVSSIREGKSQRRVMSA